MRGLAAAETEEKRERKAEKPARAELKEGIVKDLTITN
tara:strand:- start:65 stop:178 length:114 start_codon:yes stop_codon:yes gene_type:complete